MNQFEKETTLWTIEKLISEIFSLEDLREIRSTVKNRIERLAKAHKYNLKPGMKVRITGSNKLEKGTVIKINRTRAVVDVDGIEWTVPFSMIAEEIKNDTQ